MSKVKLIVEIEKRTYELIKDKPDNTAESIIANGIPYNPSGDLISREDLIKTVEKEEGISWNSHGKDVLCVRKKYIDNASPVEPFEPDYVGAERLKARQRGYEEGYHYGMRIGKTLNPQIKQGEWEEGTQGYYCSKCNYYDQSYFEHNFCPNCGADMRKGDAE